MNMRAACLAAAPWAPAAEARLAEPVMVALAEGIAAVFVDAGPDGPEGRLTCRLDGAPAGPPVLCTALDLAGGGRRRLALLGLSLETLAARRLTLAIGGRPVALADPAWLQPPVRDAAALVEGLTPAARLRLLRLVLGTGASLFQRVRPGYGAAARRVMALCGVTPAAPAAVVALGPQRILSYRLAGWGAADLVALGGRRIRPLERGALQVEPGLAHLAGDGEVVALGAAPLLLLGAGPRTPVVSAARWAAGRDRATAQWFAGRLGVAAAASPAAARIARELRPGAMEPRVVVRHLSATPGGLVYAVELADPEGFVRAVAIERGGGAVEVAPRMRLDGTGVLAGFAALPGAAEAVCRIRLIQAGGARVVTDCVPPAYDGGIPAGFGAVAALAAARASLPVRALRMEVQDFGAVEAPALTLLAPAGADPDVMHARAALVLAEPGGRRVEVVLTLAEGPRAAALRRLAGEVAAVYGVAHRLVTLAPDATPAEALRAGLEAARGAGLLLLGDAVLPEGRGWVAAWRRRLGRLGAGIVGGLLCAADGSVAEAGTAGLRGLPRALLPRSGRRPLRAPCAAAVGLSRRAAERLQAADSGHPDSGLALARLAAEERAAGRAVATDFACGLRRYGAPPVEEPLAAALRALEIGRVVGERA